MCLEHLTVSARTVAIHVPISHLPANRDAFQQHDGTFQNFESVPMNENDNTLMASFSVKTRVVVVKQRNERIKEHLFLFSLTPQGCHSNIMKMREERLEGKERREK